MLCTCAGYYGADVQTIRNYERSRAEFRKILVRFQGMGAQAQGPITTPLETVFHALSLSFSLNFLASLTFSLPFSFSRAFSHFLSLSLICCGINACR